MSDETGVLSRFLDEMSLLLNALDHQVEALDELGSAGVGVQADEMRRDVARLSGALADLASAFDIADVAALGRALAHAVSAPGAGVGPVATPGARDALAYMRWRRTQIRQAGHAPLLTAREQSLRDSLEATLVGATIGEDELARAFGADGDTLNGLSPDEQELMRTFATAELRSRDEEVDAHQLAEAAAAMAREHALWSSGVTGAGVAERLNETMQVFLSETDEDLREFSALIAAFGRDSALFAGQLHAVKLIAHKIKGTAPTLGLPELTQLASYLEWTAFAYQRQPDVPLEVVRAALARFLDLFEAALAATVQGEAPSEQTVEEARQLYDSAIQGGDDIVRPARAHVGDTGSGRSAPVRALSATGQPAARDALLQVDSTRLDELMIHLSELAVNRGVLIAAHSRLVAAQGAMATAIDRLHENSLRIADAHPAASALAPLSGPLGSDAVSRRVFAGYDSGMRAGRAGDDGGDVDTAYRALTEVVADVEMLGASLSGELVQLDQLIEGQDIVISNIQQDAIRMRLAPLADLAPRLEVVANYLASALGKRVHFSVEGEMTELDRSLMRALAEPLNQLVRNAISHGIEAPEARVDAGKPEVGSVWVHAYYSGSEVVIDVGDDGRGINEHALVARAVSIDAITQERADALTREEALRLVFHPGISALDRPGALAGSGIGLHEVETIVRALKGDISVAEASSQGSLFRITVPVTLTVLPVMEILLGDQVFTVPYSAVVHSLTDMGANIKRVQNSDDPPALSSDARALTRYTLTLPETDAGTGEGQARLEHGVDIPAYSLAQRLGIKTEQAPVAALVAQRRGARVALLVNGFGAMREAMVRPLPSYLRRRLIRGVTIRAEDGAAAMLLDVGEVVDEVLAGVVQAPVSVALPPTSSRSARRVMIVDDSVTIRRALDQMLTGAGYETALAADGYEALTMMEPIPPRVIILDVEMPRLDGYETLKIIRGAPRYAQTRVVMLTSRAAARHEAKARELGADDYLVKPCPQDTLLSAVQRLMATTENA